LAGAIKVYYQLTLEQKEAALRGWNWGQVDFQGSNLTFSVANKPAFEVPLNEVANTSLASKTEVMIEFAPPEVKGPDGRTLKVKVGFFVVDRFRAIGTILNKPNQRIGRSSG
jgi:structure-specific recognition protein 1